MPSDADLRLALGEKFGLWMQIGGEVFHLYPEGVEEWNFPGNCRRSVFRVF